MDWIVEQIPAATKHYVTQNYPETSTSAEMDRNYVPSASSSTSEKWDSWKTTVARACSSDFHWIWGQWQRWFPSGRQNLRPLCEDWRYSESYAHVYWRIRTRTQHEFVGFSFTRPSKSIELLGSSILRTVGVSIVAIKDPCKPTFRISRKRPKCYGSLSKDLDKHYRRRYHRYGWS